MSNIAVRGMASLGSLVTAGLGPQDGTTFIKDVAGTITMSGTLGAEFISEGSEGEQGETGSVGLGGKGLEATGL